MRILKCLCVVLLLSSIYTLSAQQISTDSSESLEALIQANFGQGCVDISNITSSVNGQSNGFFSYGAFNKADSNFPFENGLLLSTGNINSAGNVPNSNSLNDGNTNWETDSDLESTLGISGTLNATSIEFDFVSAANQIEFNYILASEEYNGSFPCQYSDAFAFLIRETGSTAPYTNIALIPGTSIPVNTNTIRPEIVGFCPAENESYFEGYNIGDTNFNGRTTILTASTNIIPNVQYHIKLIIADQSDQNYDSGVFIQGTNTIASVDLGPDINTCSETVLIDADLQNNFAEYQWFLDGIAIAGANNPTYLATTTGIYSVEINIQINNVLCVIEDEITLVLGSEQSADLIPDFELCDDTLNDGFEVFDLTTKDSDVTNAVPPGNYNISYHLTNAEAIAGTGNISIPLQNTSNPQAIFVRIEDIDSGCLTFSSFNLMINPSPNINQPEDIVVCDDEVSDGITLIDLDTTTNDILNGNTNLVLTYHSTLEDAESNLNPISIPYSNTNQNETLFARVYDELTGCFSTTSFDITVLDSPILNQEQQWLNACEQDANGIETFNLTTVVDSVLQGLTDVNVSFHTSLVDTQTGDNPIPNPSNYQNSIPFFEMVYMRVTSNITGCFSIVSIELHSNIVNTGFNTNSYSVCDDVSNDGIADFNLNLIQASILNGYQDFDVSFFATEDDQNTNINALDKNLPYTVFTINSEIYVTIESDLCIEFITLDLNINPAFEIQMLEPVEYCDEDFDGLTSILLESFNSYVSTGIQNPSVSYFLTEADAIDNINSLPPNYNNTENPQLIYTRVVNLSTGCFDTSSLLINIIDPPVIFQPTPIIVCDDDQDGISVVDLVSKIPEITSNTTNLNITFHTDVNEALSGTNAILNPENYTTATQFIHVRVENTVTTCFSLIGLNIYVNTLPIFIPITSYENCESDNNEIEDFFMFTKDEEILNGQTGKDVLYFETAQDALDRTNILDKNIAYQNLSNPQTIHVRVENLTDSDCFGTSSFTLEVNTFPVFNTPADISLCDDISNDGFEFIDLNYQLNDIISGITDNSLSVSFHSSFENADSNINPLPLGFTNTVNPQQIFVRIENNSFCHSITDFNISIIQAPEVNPATELVACDEDYDEIVSFDLTQIELEVLDVRNDNLDITYHESLEGAETNTELILNPNSYANSLNPQTVFIKITNNISNCYVILPFDLIVNLPPLINEIETYEICDNPTSSFDLNEINAVIVDDATDVIFSYYETLVDAQTNSNPFNTNYTYTTINDTIFVRVEFATTGCFYIYPFQLIVNPLPIANQPPDLQTCDDGSNDGIEDFNLFSVNTTVLGSQDANEFTVTYFNSEAEADLGTNPVTNNYNGADGQTIFARIENNTTGCYSLTQFNLVVISHPNVPSLIINCDTDYDASTTFDLTQAESELFDTVNPDNIISYFESIEDLENDVNVISDPTNYSNLTSPQTVYVKVFNEVANCFSYVPLELNVNLPPAIDPLDTFEVCENENGTATLSDINSSLLLQTPNVIVVYYPSELDALNQTNPLDNEYQYQSANETIFARVEFSTTHCYHIHQFELVVNPLPLANIPNDLIVCDDDYDGLYTFNLASQNAMILNGQNPNEFTISYHNDLESAEESINALNNSYEGFDGESIYVRIENNSTSCYDITSFEIIIHPKPIVDIGTQVICLDDLPLIVSANTNQAGDTYLWSTNQTSPEIEITEIGNYSVTVTSPFGCETTEVFAVIESEAADIVITESIDFSDPNNVVVTVNGIGNYLYQLDDDEPQLSNVFQNVSLGYHTLTIIDLNGCASVTKDIVVIDAPKFITPNDDGYFDTWHITGVETLPGTIIYIFDRYGKLLKTLTSNSPGWNGFYNGNLMPASDYWYLAKVRKGDIAFEVKGHFTLRR